MNTITVDSKTSIISTAPVTSNQANYQIRREMLALSIVSSHLMPMNEVCSAVEPQMDR